MPTQWSIALPNTETSSTTAIRRGINHEEPLNLITAPPSFNNDDVSSCKTLYQAIRIGLKQNPKGPCLGHRVITLDNTNEVQEVSPFIYLTYEQVVGKIDAIAAGLRDWNLVERNEDGFLLVRTFYYYIYIICFSDSIHWKNTGQYCVSYSLRNVGITLLTPVNFVPTTSP